MKKIKDYPLLKRFMEMLIAHCKTNHMLSCIDPVKDYSETLGQILNAELKKFSFCAGIETYYIDFLPDPALLEEEYCYYIMLKNAQNTSFFNVLIEYTPALKYSVISLSFTNLKMYLPFVRDFLDKEGLFMEDYLEEPPQKIKIPEVKVMSFEKMKEFFSELTEQGKLIKIEVD